MGTAQKGAGRTWRGTVAAGLVVLAMLALVGVVLARSWSTAGDRVSTVATERTGVACLRPLTQLLGALVTARDQAVRGTSVDTDGLRTRTAQVDGAAQAAHLGTVTGRRWSDLRARLVSLTGPQSGPADADAYADAVALAAGLVKQIGDATGLTTDSEPAASQLADAVVHRLTTLLATLGLAADVVAHPDNAQADDRTVALAVARYQIADAAARLGDAVRASAAADSTAPSTDLISRQDALQAAVDSFAPPTVLRSLTGPADSRTLAVSAQQIRTAAPAVAEAALAALDRLLAARHARLAGDQRLIIAASLGALLCVLAMLWLWAPARHRPVLPDGTDGDTDQPAAAEEYVVDPVALVDARDLLLQELVHVGRGVRAPARETNDDL